MGSMVLLTIVVGLSAFVAGLWVASALDSGRDPSPDEIARETVAKLRSELVEERERAERLFSILSKEAKDQPAGLVAEIQRERRRARNRSSLRTPHTQARRRES